jgi:hypothetical protein
MANVIDFKSDNLIELLGPVDRTTGLPVPKGTTVVNVKLFDSNKDTYVTALETTLSEDEAAAESTLSVQSTVGFFPLDFIRIDLDDGTVREDAILSLTADSFLISGGLDSAAAKGSVIRRYTLLTNTTHISVKDTSGWSLGDRCSVSLDATSTSFHVEKVIQVFDDFLVLDSALASNCSTGNSVACSIETGANIALLGFGTFPTTVATTVEGDPAWGFRGTLPSTSFDIFTGEAGNLGLQLGQRVRIEYTMTLIAGPIMFRNAIATVVNL